MYAVNETVPGIGGAAYDLSGGERVHWYNSMLNYYKVLTTLDKTSIYPGDSITATVTWTNLTGTYSLSGASVNVSDTAYVAGPSVGTTGPDGNVTFEWSTPGTWYVYAVDPVHGSGIDNYPAVSFTCIATGGMVTVNAEAGNVPPYVCYKWEEPDDDEATNGTQVVPNLYPVNKTVTVKACVCDPSGNEDIANVTATVTGPEGSPTYNVTLSSNVSVNCSECACTPATSINCTGYSGTFDMEACDPAGNYLVNVTAEDNGGLTNSSENTFEYLSIIGLDLDLNAVGFGTVAPGETKIVPGDDAWGAPNLTVRSIGNGPINITVSATDMTSGSNVITKDNIASEIGALGSQWLSVPREFGVGLECCRDKNANLSLHMPEGTVQGAYTGKVTFVAKHA